jgi:hypothetical protein
MNGLTATSLSAGAETPSSDYHRTNYRLQMVCEPGDVWSVHGLPGIPVVRCDSLPECFDFARRECAAAPATIELTADGFFAVIYQELGWSRPRVSG